MCDFYQVCIDGDYTTQKIVCTCWVLMPLNSGSVTAQFPATIWGSSCLCACFIYYSMYPTASGQRRLKPTLTGTSAFLPPAKQGMSSFSAVGTNFLPASDRSGVTLSSKPWCASAQFLPQFRSLQDLWKWHLSSSAAAQGIFQHIMWSLFPSGGIWR